MKKWLLALTLLTFLGLTAGFTASMEPVKRQATPDDPAVFQVTIQNNGSSTGRFVLNYDFTKSGWIYFDTSATLEPGEQEKINITINPGQDAIQQSYRFTVYVTRYGTGETVEMTDYMSVLRQHDLNIKDFTIGKTSYKPGEEVTGSITVQNLASRIISDYRFYSTFAGNNKTQNGIAIAPGALKTYSFTHRIPEDAAPGQRNFSIITVQGNDVQTLYRNITVEEIRNVTRTTSQEDMVLYRTGDLVVSNSGNSGVNLTEEMTFPAYLDSILTFEPEPDSRETVGSSVTYYWDISLQPGERQEITYRINYWIPLAIAAAILVGIVLLRRLSGSVRIVKKVEEVEGDTLKISIELENNSEKLQNGLKVRDFVPNVAELDEDFQMTKPDTKRTTEGIELEWSIDDFKPGEERVIQYEIKPKVEIEGGMELQSAQLMKEGEILRKSSRK